MRDFALERAKRIRDWRYSRWMRLVDLGAAISLEDLEEAEHLYRLAQLDLEEMEERRRGDRTSQATSDR